MEDQDFSEFCETLELDISYNTSQITPGDGH